eukprot:Clim_evm11s73 gene=Clim_evmTU11s73
MASIELTIYNSYNWRAVETSWLPKQPNAFSPSIQDTLVEPGVSTTFTWKNFNATGYQTLTMDLPSGTATARMHLTPGVPGVGSVAVDGISNSIIGAAVVWGFHTTNGDGSSQSIEVCDLMQYYENGQCPHIAKADIAGAIVPAAPIPNGYFQPSITLTNSIPGPDPNNTITMSWGKNSTMAAFHMDHTELKHGVTGIYDYDQTTAPCNFQDTLVVEYNSTQTEYHFTFTENHDRICIPQLLSTGGTGNQTTTVYSDFTADYWGMSIEICGTAHFDAHSTCPNFTATKVRGFAMV